MAILPNSEHRIRDACRIDQAQSAVDWLMLAISIRPVRASAYLVELDGEYLDQAVIAVISQ